MDMKIVRKSNDLRRLMNKTKEQLVNVDKKFTEKIRVAKSNV